VNALWVTILAASFGCYGLKLAGVSLPESVLNHPRVQRIAGLLPIAMLSALIATDLLDSDRHYAADWHTIAGVGGGGLALWRGRSLLVVFVVAVATTALLRTLLP
jgi:branched-subunit amino acid transport protein